MNGRCQDCDEYCLDCECKIKDNWISVKNLLPPLDKKVLLCDMQGWICTGYNAGISFDVGSGEEPGCEITHWMPLPEAPTT